VIGGPDSLRRPPAPLVSSGSRVERYWGAELVLEPAGVDFGSVHEPEFQINEVEELSFGPPSPATSPLAIRIAIEPCVVVLNGALALKIVAPRGALCY
jgi:hypothetical protein